MSTKNITNQYESLFVVDSSPIEDFSSIPSYNRRIEDVVPKNIDISITDDLNDSLQDGICFNCDGNHNLRDCKSPKNYERINKNRRSLQSTIRYHVEDDQRFGHFQAGCISNALRGALGLGPKQLPMHVYKMRVLGYPPGWLEEHKIKQSGLTLFGSQNVYQAPDDNEDGEIVVSDQKCKYDIKKLITYPGFNTKPETGTLDESNTYGVPCFDPTQDISFMIKRIAEDALESYKKRKLENGGQLNTEINNSEEDMDVANDEPSPSKVNFNMNNAIVSSTPNLSPDGTIIVSDEDLFPPGVENSPVRMHDTLLQNIRSSSPSLIELENTKRMLLEELNSSCDSPISGSILSQNGACSPEETLTDVKSIVNEEKINNGKLDNSDIEKLSEINNDMTIEKKNENDISSTQKLDNKHVEIEEIKLNDSIEALDEIASNTISSNNDLIILNENDNSEFDDNINESTEENSSISFNCNLDCTEANLSLNTTPIESVKRTSLNTPVINYTRYSRIPKADCFSKEIADIINFENLPDALGKYDTMRGVIKKVRCALQDIK